MHTNTPITSFERIKRLKTDTHIHKTIVLNAHERILRSENTNFVHAHMSSSWGFVFQTLNRFGASGGLSLESVRSAIAAYIFSADVFLLNAVCYALPFLQYKNARPGIRAPNESHIL